jgi:hypothetical protein
MRRHLFIRFGADRQDELGIDQRQVELVGAACVPNRLEAVLLDQVENRNRTLVLDIRRRTADRIVEDNVAQPVAGSSQSLPLEIEADRDRACVSVETLRICKGNGSRPKRPQLVWTEPEDRRALHIVEHRKA